MTPLDPAAVRAAVGALDSLATQASEVARTEVPGLFARQAARDLAANAELLHGSALDTIAAVGALGDDVATALTPIRDAADGAALTNAKAAQHIAFGGRVRSATASADAEVRRIVGAATDQELRALLQQAPRQLDSDQLATLRALLETRDVVGGAGASVASDVTAAGLGEDAARLVDQLHAEHLRLTGADATVMTERVAQLLGRPGRQLDVADVAELQALLRAGGDQVAPDLPRTLGTTSLDATLGSIRSAPDAADEARSLLDVYRSTLDQNALDLDARARLLLGEHHRRDPGSITQLRALLDLPGTAGDELRASWHVTDDARPLLRDSSEAAEPAFHEELEALRWRRGGIATDAPRIQRVIADLLSEPVDQLPARHFSGVAAVARLADEHPSIALSALLDDGVDGIGAIRELARGATPNATHRHVVAAWRSAVDGTRSDAATRATAIRELLDLDDAAITEPDTWARLRTLVDADAASAAPALALDAGGVLPVRDALRTPGASGSRESVLRHMERWRVDLDGTAADATRVRDELDVLLARPEGELSAREWRRLNALVDADARHGHLGLTRAIDDTSDADSVLAAHAAGSRSVDHVTRRYLEQWRAVLDESATNPDVRAGAVRSIVERDASSLAPADWSRLQALVAAERATPGARPLAMELEHVGTTLDVTLERLASGSTAELADARQYLAAWDAQLAGHADDAASLRGALRSTLERDPTELTPHELARLGALLDVDRATGHVGLATQLDGVGDTANVVRGMLRRERAVDPAVLRMFASWRTKLSGAADDPAALRTMVRELTGQDPATRTPAEWTRLHALLDADRTAGGAIGLADATRSVAGVDDILGALAGGSRKVDGEVQRLVQALDLQASGVTSDRDQLLAAAREVLDTPRDERTARDWARLWAVLDASGTDRPTTSLHQSIDGLDPAIDVVRGLADGSRRLDATADRYLALWGAQLDGAGADVPGRLLPLLERETTSLATEDWSRIRTLLDLDAAAGAGRFTRELHGAVGANDVLASLADGTRQVGGNARRYVATWRTQADGSATDPTRLRAQVLELLERPAAELDQDEWIRMRTLLDALRETRSVHLPRSLDGLHPADDLLEALGDGNGSTLNMQAVEQYLRTWQHQLDGTSASAERTATGIRALLDRPVEELEPNDWVRLMTLVDGDAARTQLGLVDELRGIDDAADVLGRSTVGTAPDASTRRYLDAWRLQLDGTAADADRMRAALTPLVGERSGWDAEDLRRLQSLLDADEATGSLTLARQLAGAGDPAAVISKATAGDEAAVATLGRYARTWSAQLDGTVADRTGLARDARRVLATHRSGAEVTAQDWDTLARIVDLDEAGGVLGLGREASGMRPAHEVLADAVAGSGKADELARYAELWSMQLDGTASSRTRLAAALEPLVRRPAAELQADDWKQLQLLLDADRYGRGIGLVDAIGTTTASTQVTAAAGGTPPADLERYLGAWRMQLDGADRPATMRGLLGTEIDTVSADLTGASLERLRSIHDIDRATGTLGLRGRIAGVLDADALITRAMTGDSTQRAAARKALPRYLETWRAQLAGTLDDPATVRTALREAIDRDIAELTPADWARVHALIDSDPSRRVLGITRTITGADADSIVSKLAGGTAVDAGTRQLVDTWRLQLDGTLVDRDMFRNDLRRVLELPTEQRSIDDWIRLRNLVDADAQLNHVGLSRTLRGQDYAQFMQHHVDGKAATPLSETYPRIWKLQLDGTMQDPARLREAALRMVSRNPSELTRADWIVLAHLYDLDRATGTLGLNRFNAGGTAVEAAVAKAVTGQLEAGYQQRLLGNWRLDLGGGYAVPESIALRDGKLAAHMIRRSDVPAFLADSAYPHTVFHGNTNRETYEHIVERGARTEKNKRSQWGKGFYNALEPGGWGDDVLEVAVRSRTPMVVDTAEQLQARLAEIRRRVPGAPSDTQGALLAGGYDSLVIRHGSAKGGDWLIGLRNEDIKVVVEDAAGQLDRRPPSPWRFDDGARQ